MKKTIKGILAVLIAVSLLLGMVACGGGESSSIDMYKKSNQWFMFGVIVAVFFGLYKWNKIISLKALRKYYAQKRLEFPWLDNWIKQNGDPSLSRARGNSISGVVIAMVVLVALGLITQFLGKTNFINTIVYIAISIVVFWLVGRSKTIDGNYVNGGVTLECPSCHCPHSWGVIKNEIIIDSKSNQIEEIKYTYNDGSVKYKKVKIVVYEGRETDDFNCLNCGETRHLEYNREWKHYENEEDKAPKPNVINYNPPKTVLD